MENELGLPVEYQEHPEYFDAFNVNENTVQINQLIEKLLSQQGAKTVLDMTCGTGSQVFYLHDCGYQVVGSDFSPALIEQAREKTRQRKVDIEFIEGDMRTLRVGSFDAVISIDNAIGHLTKPEFEVALQNIHSNLNPGGTYIFDILNYSAMTDSVLKNDTSHHFATIGNQSLHAIQFSTLDKEQNRLISHHYDLIQAAVKAPYIEQSRCALQLYTAEELQKILSALGFEVIDQYDMEGQSLNPEKSFSILTVARKR